MPVLDGPDAYWLESRPQEKGRSVVVRRTPDGNLWDVTPPEFSVRTKVHEYGGGAYTVRDGVVYFSNAADGRLYAQRPGEQPVPLTPGQPWRYADMDVDPVRR
ncbi:MAG: S9 family peptidase, partial [SAR202 cluster bacterium]|nr:S9 family peptidase [SAR202 cluster bacterium]